MESKGINEMERFEEIPIDDFSADLDESYLDNVIDRDSGKNDKNEQVKE